MDRKVENLNWNETAQVCCETSQVFKICEVLFFSRNHLVTRQLYARLWLVKAGLNSKFKMKTFTSSLPNELLDKLDVIAKQYGVAKTRSSKNLLKFIWISLIGQNMQNPIGLPDRTEMLWPLRKKAWKHTSKILMKGICNETGWDLGFISRSYFGKRTRGEDARQLLLAVIY